MTNRHHTVAEIIREQAATFIRNEANTTPLITVTRVDVAPNYRAATIFITTVPDGREDDALIFLQRHARDLRGTIKHKTKLKYLPHLTFAVDGGERHRQRLDEIVNEHMDSSETPSEDTST